jgi:PPOX class probable F420-dependent enzyme
MVAFSEPVKAILTKSNNAIIGVNRRGGGPQLTPVWYAWDGNNFYFSTTKDRFKYINIKRDPSISLIVDDLDEHTYVSVYGKAEIVEHDFADKLRPIIQKYLPADKTEQFVSGVVKDPSRVIVVLRPEKVVANK